MSTDKEEIALYYEAKNDKIRKRLGIKGGFYWRTAKKLSVAISRGVVAMDDAGFDKEDFKADHYSISDTLGELAKNEIYARHGRKFVTQRIADYFNSKSWYKGTVEPETFDADTSVFNEYEVANIQKIADTEGKLRSEGK